MFMLCRWRRLFIFALVCWTRGAGLAADESAAPSGSGREHQTVRTNPLPSLEDAVSAKRDVWGEAAMAQPNGPSYDFFARLLPPPRCSNLSGVGRVTPCASHARSIIGTQGFF